MTVRFMHEALWSVPNQNQFLKLQIHSDILVGFLRRGIGTLQLLFLHRTAQRTYIHASSGIRSHDPRSWATQDRLCFNCKQPDGLIKPNLGESAQVVWGTLL